MDDLVEGNMYKDMFIGKVPIDAHVAILTELSSKLPDLLKLLQEHPEDDGRYSDIGRIVGRLVFWNTASNIWVLNNSKKYIHAATDYTKRSTYVENPKFEEALKLCKQELKDFKSNRKPSFEEAYMH